MRQALIYNQDQLAEALKEKGYNPIDQLAGYLLSGDPAYVTSYKDARLEIRRFERYELIEALLQAYLEESGR